MVVNDFFMFFVNLMLAILKTELGFYFLIVGIFIWLYSWFRKLSGGYWS